jgi:ferredoxin
VKVAVDLAACECHGQCEIVAPTVFKLEDETNLSWDAAPPESAREDAEAAVVMCPTQAITVAD